MKRCILNMIKSRENLTLNATHSSSGTRAKQVGATDESLAVTLWPKYFQPIDNLSIHRAFLQLLKWLIGLQRGRNSNIIGLTNSFCYISRLHQIKSSTAFLIYGRVVYLFIFLTRIKYYYYKLNEHMNLENKDYCCITVYTV